MVPILRLTLISFGLMVNYTVLEWLGSLITLKFLDKHHNCPFCCGHTIVRWQVTGDYYYLHMSRDSVSPVRFLLFLSWSKNCSLTTTTKMPKCQQNIKLIPTTTKKILNHQYPVASEQYFCSSARGRGWNPLVHPQGIPRLAYRVWGGCPGKSWSQSPDPHSPEGPGQRQRMWTPRRFGQKILKNYISIGGKSTQ